MLNKKHNLKSIKTKIRERDLKEQDRKPNKEKGLQKKCYWMFLMLFFSWNKSREERKRKRQKQGIKRKQTRKTRRKEEREEQERDRERESEKGGGQKRLRRSKGRHSKINKNVLFRVKNSFFSIESKGKDKKRSVSGQVRWPFGPPHLTLINPPKKQTRKTQKKKRSLKKHFSVISQIIFWWGSNMSLFWQLGQKSAHPKNTIKIGVSATHVLKNRCASRNGHLWTPKTQNRKFQLSFLFFVNNKKHKFAEIPIFIVFLQTWERDVSKVELKTQTFGKNVAPFFWKRLFLEIDR